MKNRINNLYYCTHSFTSHRIPFSAEERILCEGMYFFEESTFTLQNHSKSNYKYLNVQIITLIIWLSVVLLVIFCVESYNWPLKSNISSIFTDIERNFSEQIYYINNNINKWQIDLPSWNMLVSSLLSKCPHKLEFCKLFACFYLQIAMPWF